MAEDYVVTAGAGSLRGSGVRFQHRWTEEGVTVEAPFTGAHLMHLSVAACVLNDLYREAAARGLRVDGVRVEARGGFDTSTWAGTGVTYAVTLDSPEPAEVQASLVAAVDEVAEIPRALRTGMTVTRTPD